VKHPLRRRESLASRCWKSHEVWKEHNTREVARIERLYKDAGDKILEQVEDWIEINEVTRKTLAADRESLDKEILMSREAINNDRIALETERSLFALRKQEIEAEKASLATIRTSLAARQSDLDLITPDSDVLTLAKQLEDIKDKRACKLCYAMPADVFELQCGHVWCCSDCHGKRVEHGVSLRCGVCNSGEGIVQKVYFCE
jgi:hypothetical protein